MSVVSVWHATTADVLDDDARRRQCVGLALARGSRCATSATDSRRTATCFCSAASWPARSSARRSAWVRATGNGAKDRAAGRKSLIRRPPERSPSTSRTARASSCARFRATATVGVDVEHRLRPPVDARMVRRYCAPCEVADIERQGPSAWQDQFLKYWTLKEAYLKARGLGHRRATCPISASRLAPTRFAWIGSTPLSADDDARVGVRPRCVESIALRRGGRDGPGRRPPHLFDRAACLTTCCREIAGDERHPHQPPRKSRRADGASGFSGRLADRRRRRRANGPNIWHSRSMRWCRDSHG